MGRDIRQRDRLQSLREDRRGPRRRGSDPADRLSADRQEPSGLSQWLRTYGAVALRLLIAGTFLTLLFTVIPFSEVLHALGGANVLYVLIGLSLQVVLRFVGALRVRILTGPQGISLSALRIFEISCASTFYGLLLPGDLAGGVVRWYKLSRPDRKPTEVLVVMVVDRILDTILLILIGVVFWAIDARLTVAAPRVFLTLGGTVAVLLLITAAILDRRLSRFWIRLAGSRRVPRILRRRLDAVRDSVLCIQQVPKISLAKFLALMIARHALGLLSLYLLAVALGMSLTFVQVGSIRSAMLIVTLLPITVSGLGVREASLVFLCGHYGAAATNALAWSLLIFSGLIVVALIGGVGELRNAWSRRRRTEGSRARR